MVDSRDRHFVLVSQLTVIPVDAAGVRVLIDRTETKWFGFKYSILNVVMQLSTYMAMSQTVCRYCFGLDLNTVYLTSLCCL